MSRYFPKELQSIPSIPTWAEVIVIVNLALNNVMLFRVLPDETAVVSSPGAAVLSPAVEKKKQTQR